MIKVRNLCKSFDDQCVLNDLSLDIADGEIMVVLGRSGSGKSVLLKHMIGLIKPDSGTVEINGKTITGLSERELLQVRREIGYLFQEGALYDFMTVYDNLAFPLREHSKKLSQEEIRRKVHDVLEHVDLEDVEDKLPAQLSGGMKKRVGLARALIMNTKTLFCDEPTSGLDPIRSKDISDLIRNISRKFKCTTVVVSHDLYNSFRIADRLALLDEGRIVALGTKEEFLASTNATVREYIGSTQLAH